MDLCNHLLTDNRVDFRIGVCAKGTSMPRERKHFPLPSSTIVLTPYLVRTNAGATRTCWKDFAPILFIPTCFWRNFSRLITSPRISSMCAMAMTTCTSFKNFHGRHCRARKPLCIISKNCDSITEIQQGELPFHCEFRAYDGLL